MEFKDENKQTNKQTNKTNKLRTQKIKKPKNIHTSLVFDLRGDNSDRQRAKTETTYHPKENLYIA